MEEVPKKTRLAGVADLHLKEAYKCKWAYYFK
jgi:hypothetical protein